MPQLTFMQNMADKASRLLPCSFTEIVEETTSAVLVSPDYENMMFICDQTNARPDNARDVVMAIRRRIDNPNPKVQYFVVILLDTLVKNCYEDLHNEIADTPALQNCLIEIAVRTPIRDGEFEAKKAALQLILNMSYWFIGATEDKTKMLSKLADEVRQQTSPLAFEDIEADATFQLKRAPARRGAAASAQQQQAAAFRVSRSRQQHHQGGGQGPHQGGQRHQQAHGGGGSAAAPRIVDAIPVFQYTEQEISGMLDACMLLSETINAAEEEKRSIIGDDLVTSIAVQVRRDHRKLSTLLSSGAQMDNLDVLLSVTDSQTALVQRLSELVARDGQRLRDVANIGAEEDDSAVTLENANRPAQAPPAQITRSNPSSPHSALAVGGAFRAGGQRPRQGDIDGHDAVEMNDSNSVPAVPAPSASAATVGPLGGSDGSNHTMAEANPVAASPTGDGTARRTVEATASPSGAPNQSKTNEQELDDFFGGSSSTPQASPSPAQQQPAPAAATTAPNTDFFANNAPAAGTEPKPATVGAIGSVNGGGATGGDDFDAFLNSRLPQ